MCSMKIPPTIVTVSANSIVPLTGLNLHRCHQEAPLCPLPQFRVDDALQLNVHNNYSNGQRLRN